MRVVSALLTGAALAELALAEDTLRHEADGVFALADGIAADLPSFVWLVLQLHAASPAPQSNPIDALDALYHPGNGRTTIRWLQTRGRAAAVFENTDRAPAGRCAPTGTSLGSARYLDRLANQLAVLLDRHTVDDATGNTGGDRLTDAEEWPLQRSLDFLTERQVFDRLLEHLPGGHQTLELQGPGEGAGDRGRQIAGNGGGFDRLADLRAEGADPVPVMRVEAGQLVELLVDRRYSWHDPPEGVGRHAEADRNADAFDPRQRPEARALPSNDGDPRGRPGPRRPCPRPPASLPARPRTATPGSLNLPLMVLEARSRLLRDTPGTRAARHQHGRKGTISISFQLNGANVSASCIDVVRVWP